ncbi:bifunctional 2',3'-cyclic-nucleotide 2'-phosphodiesterase/3'-nucleotidase [Ruixingdingia sedimenti]|uniref:Bifunctional 2',3'-cyclic-nucleotide 2'-phosphodiesterase/3'-nucleotidase n=1 Tax=Ruixingdingia sedimenti TaxID=3073604 RepID=A0ABU1F5S1_9RHOB|nr:bifunctional 2',3'-cyclic-nucleotide 2'-phosphodiesterase/3'-nucleotidase [Xinfangfangia sp. LG-4]MDR5652218.1 bifunctional 2',3'-cyclic-nucleotide 2'-phosphodiesterase/3'-nucleotidase [Xinfangfangia sp. LG-4]
MPPPRPPRPAAPVIRLRILATSDLHVQIPPHDYYRDRPLPGMGLAQAAHLIRALRAEAANCLLFDNGDFLQGTPLGDYLAELRPPTPAAPHPMVAAMNLLGYDAGTLGNHEFNYGLPFLRAALAGAAFPLVSANLHPIGDEPPLAPPHLLLDRQMRDAAGAVHRLRIGVTGFLPPQVTMWDRTHLAGRFATSDILTAARRQVAALRAAGADLVVALSHSGIGAAGAGAGTENVTLDLAGVAGIDAVIAGHSHLVFPDPAFAGIPGVDVAGGRLRGTPAVMPGHSGSHVGVIELELRRGAGGWQVAAGHGRALSPAALGAEPAEDVLAAAAADHAATRARLSQVVGHSRAALHSHFALTHDSAAVRLIAQAQAAHVARALAGGPFGGLPVLAAAAPFKSGGHGGQDHYTDVPAGAITLRDLADISPYPNRIAAVVLTGAQLRAWLEHASGIFRRLVPGRQDQPLIDPDTPGYHFDLIEGLRYTIDLTRPFRRASDPGEPGRIRDLHHRGRPVDPAARFVLATNSYRAAGGGGFPGTGAGTGLDVGQATIREVIAAHLAATGPFAPPAAPVWRFAPLPGTSALFDTGPAAARLPTPAGVTPVGPTAQGFLRLRLRF